MTLDEAIAKAKADGDVQLAEWLRQARGADAAAKWYTEKLRDAHRTIRKLFNENAKLREQLAKARDPQRIGGTADHESFVYAIEQLREFRWQHATNDEEAIPYINNVADAHEHERAKLRKQYETVLADYRSEVARLRELVDYMTPIAWYAASERERDRMRELEVEL